MAGLAQKLTSPLLLISGGLTVFGWWGLHTPAGMRTFDELDGLIPFFGGVLGLAGLCTGALLVLLRKVRL